MSNQLTILEKQILQIDNLYNLNLVHQANGELRKHQPSNFLRLDTTQELIAEIESDGQTQAVKVYRGSQGGTYVCEELVLSYAMWISPKFHLIVLRAFLAMHKAESQNANQIQPLVERKYTFEFTEYELEQLVWLWCSHSQMNTLLGQLEKPLEAIGSRFSAITYSHHHEYKRHYLETKDTIARLVEPFQQSERLNWTRAISLINRAVTK
ncbi:P22AR C-terminal domain-containing protein [Haemophilus sp. Marseille-Q0026]|jgi:genome|uniref:P22AR C-terminal domain-containing protein n=1 Tax=Haemophilus sp. Marseille-Q0026 TaxID=2866580 RepID=UPI001CF8C6CB|nr:P22AR C-terminal domain-containing protein [Haemophilus sp. Marseille-Q0026]DAQ59265.1 MAG TPA: KilA protein [Caudoviricetes sp.]